MPAAACPRGDEGREHRSRRSSPPPSAGAVIEATNQATLQRPCRVTTVVTAAAMAGASPTVA